MAADLDPDGFSQRTPVSTSKLKSLWTNTYQAFEILKRTLLLNGEGLPRHVSSEQRVRFLASRAGVFRSEHGTLSKKDEDGEGAWTVETVLKRRIFGCILLIN